MLPPDRLCAEKLRRDLGRVHIGREIIVRERTGSTNDSLWQLARRGAQEGLVVFAEYQSAGRGRRGNRWESAPYKGLWFSVLLRQNINLADAPQLAQRTAAMVAATVQNELHVPATVKLPNDIYVADRKVGGVLVEMRAQRRAAHVAIVGIGLNVNHQPEDFSSALRERATSLAIVWRGQIDRHRFAVALLRTLNLLYAPIG